MLKYIQDYLIKRKIIKSSIRLSATNQNIESITDLFQQSDEIINSILELIVPWSRLAEKKRDPGYAYYKAVYSDINIYQHRRKTNQIEPIKAALIIEIYKTIERWRTRYIVDNDEDHAKLLCTYYIEIMRKKNLSYSRFIDYPYSALPDYWGYR
ncbi:MAG: hypothetical protein H8D45_08680 [Bacteroidetes bacterium]|nr:hypothetical protein [Bacteroidota bacterium]MBL7066604.1 hypothetical protein [Candidatus Neomarinimicrobiota bacterium]